MDTTDEQAYPDDSFLNKETIPSIWCSGCGIGVAVHALIQAVQKTKIDRKTISVVAGVGCTGRVINHVKFNSSFQVGDNAIRHGVHLLEKNHAHKVVVFVNDADFMASSADDLFLAGKKNVNLFVVYINNFLYHILIKHRNIKTPFEHNLSNGHEISPFNIPHVAKLSGARYVARWTPLHVRQLLGSMIDVLQNPVFSLVEVVTPCLLYYASEGFLGKRCDRMQFFYDTSVIKHGEPTENCDIRQTQLVVGRFIEPERL